MVSRRSLKGINGRQVKRALERAGFEVVRVNGSHHTFRRPGVPGSKVIVPIHGTHDLLPGTLGSILAQSGLTLEEFVALL